MLSAPYRTPPYILRVLRMSKLPIGETGLSLVNELHRLELRVEQLQIHLSSLNPHSADVPASVVELAATLRQITTIKARCRTIDPALILSRGDARRLH